MRVLELYRHFAASQNSQPQPDDEIVKEKSVATTTNIFLKHEDEETSSSSGDTCCSSDDKGSTSTVEDEAIGPSHFADTNAKSEKIRRLQAKLRFISADDV